jgi:hypothetical protein
MFLSPLAGSFADRQIRLAECRLLVSQFQNQFVVRPFQFAGHGPLDRRTSRYVWPRRPDSAADRPRRKRTGLAVGRPAAVGGASDAGRLCRACLAAASVDRCGRGRLAGGSNAVSAGCGLGRSAVPLSERSDAVRQQLGSPSLAISGPATDFRMGQAARAGSHRAGAGGNLAARYESRPQATLPNGLPSLLRLCADRSAPAVDRGRAAFGRRGTPPQAGPPGIQRLAGRRPDGAVGTGPSGTGPSDRRISLEPSAGDPPCESTVGPRRQRSVAASRSASAAGPSILERGGIVFRHRRWTSGAVAGRIALPRGRGRHRTGASRPKPGFRPGQPLRHERRFLLVAGTGVHTPPTSLDCAR